MRTFGLVHKMINRKINIVVKLSVYLVPFREYNTVYKTVIHGINPHFFVHTYLPHFCGIYAINEVAWKQQK